MTLAHHASFPDLDYRKNWGYNSDGSFGIQSYSPISVAEESHGFSHESNMPLKVDLERDYLIRLSARFTAALKSFRKTKPKVTAASNALKIEGAKASLELSKQDGSRFQLDLLDKVMQQKAVDAARFPTRTKLRGRIGARGSRISAPHNRERRSSDLQRKKDAFSARDCRHSLLLSVNDRNLFNQFDSLLRLPAREKNKPRSVLEFITQIYENSQKVLAQPGRAGDRPRF